MLFCLAISLNVVASENCNVFIGGVKYVNKAKLTRILKEAGYTTVKNINFAAYRVSTYHNDQHDFDSRISLSLDKKKNNKFEEYFDVSAEGLLFKGIAILKEVEQRIPYCN